MFEEILPECTIAGTYKNCKFILKIIENQMFCKLRMLIFFICFLQIHEGRKDHKCMHCMKGFGTLNNLKRHIETVHEGIKRFKCNPCDKAYSQSHELKKHFLTCPKAI